MPDQKIEGSLHVTNSIGIGIDTPNAQLHIDADTTEGKVLVESGSNLFKLSVDSLGAAIGTVNAVPFTLQTDGNSRLTINALGDVGIGKNPTFKLDVNGIVNATGFNKGGVPWKLKTGDLEDNAITTAKIADNAVTASKIADGAIAATKLASTVLSGKADLAGAITQDFAAKELTIRKLAVKEDVKVARMGITFESSQEIEVNSTTLQQLNAAIAQSTQAVQTAQTATQTALTQATEAENAARAALQLVPTLINIIQSQIAAQRPGAIALLQMAIALQSTVAIAVAQTDAAQTAVRVAVDLQAPPASLESLSKAMPMAQAAQTAIAQSVQLSNQIAQQAPALAPGASGIAQQTTQAIQAAQTQIGEVPPAIAQAQTAGQTAQTALNHPLLEILAYGIGARLPNSQVYDSYAFHRWRARGMEKLLLKDNGNLYVGNTASESNAKLTVDDPSLDTIWNTAAFRKPAIGPNWSHIHHGPQGDWYIRSAANEGRVVLQDSGGTVQIGGNRSGAFVRFNDDLWFSDPQNGTIEIKNATTSDWGTMVGRFNPPSSAIYKQNIAPLQTADLDRLLEDTLNLNLVRYQYKGEDSDRRLNLGVIAEECPDYIVGHDGKSLSTAEYIAMLHGAIKVLATKIAALEQSTPARL